MDNQQQGQSYAQPSSQILVHQHLQMFWSYQRQEMEHAGDFKNHQLPLARIKKIMKADEDVRMISAEAPVLFAKACELFILELTIRSWLHAEENKRRTLQRNDVAAAITRTEIFDFLVDIVPREETKDDGGAGLVGASIGVPCYYPPAMGQPSSAGSVTVGQPAVARIDPVYIHQQQQLQGWEPIWQPGQAGDEGGDGRSFDDGAHPSGT